MNKKQLLEDYLLQNVDSAYRFAYTYTRNREDAEDIVNESVIKAIRSVHTLNQPESIKPWFYKIIANTALTQLKKKSKLSYINYEEVQELEGKEDQYSLLTFDGLIQALEPKYREVVILRFLEEMSFKEIAQTLDLNENTVKTRLYTALRQLRIEMEGEQFGEI